MKKLLAILVCLLMLTGCGHTHEWEEANCTTPKTCTECGETEGEALGHTWAEATCTEPKTCTVCGETEGNALGHAWAEATCTEPKICTVCGETDGDPLGHESSETSCTEDTVCSRCGETVPAPGHIFSDATCTEPATCTVCGETEGEPLGHTTSGGVCDRCGQTIYETVNGSGDDVVSDIALGKGIYRVHFTHTGRRNFIVKAYDADNDKDLLINDIGSYDGYVLLMGESPFSLEITADGEWSYTIEPVSETTDTSFSGTGDYVTDTSPVKSGTWQFTHDGSSNFIVRVYTTKGRSLLVNEIGAYDGKKILSIPSGSLAIFEINADGNWTIQEAQ